MPHASGMFFEREEDTVIRAALFRVLGYGGPLAA